MLGSALKGISSKGALTCPGSAPRGRSATLFLTKYLFPFEVASLLLLVAAIGAVVLARRRRGLEPDDGARAAAPTPRGRLHRDDGRGGRDPRGRAADS